MAIESFYYLSLMVYRKTRDPAKILLTKFPNHNLSEISALVNLAGVTQQTYYRWRREYGGMRIGEARRSKELELDQLIFE